MKAELYKRLFRAIFSEDISSLKKIAMTIIQEEHKLGHNNLANSLEKISIEEKPKYTLFDSRKSESGLSTLPKSKRTDSQLMSYIPRGQLKHHMILPNEVEERLLSIEQEYVARERLKKFNLVPKRKILLYGPPGCGKTLSAERIAWNLGLPLSGDLLRHQRRLRGLRGGHGRHRRGAGSSCPYPGDVGRSRRRYRRGEIGRAHV